jgi:hypothetical protein
MIKLRRMGFARCVTHMRDKRSAYKVLVGKSEGKSPLGRPSCGWENNVKIDLKEMG